MTPMEETKRVAPGVTRRDFLGMIGASAMAAGALGGTLAGCAPASEEKLSAMAADAAGAMGGFSWEAVSGPIDESQIAETVEREVVIVGAGMSGLCAALATGEAGLSAVVLSKTEASSGFATQSAVWNTQHQKDIGLPERMDAVDYTTQWMKACSNVPNRKFMNMWLERSGSDMDWMLLYLEPEGLVEWMDDSAPEAVMVDWVNGAPMLEAKAAAFGVEFLRNTPAMRLEREEGGRVTAVIAEVDKGVYKRFAASKGVIICAGDYNGDEEMMEHFLPWASGFRRSQPANVNMGDMLKAAHWVGGRHRQRTAQLRDTLRVELLGDGRARRQRRAVVIRERQGRAVLQRGCGVPVRALPGYRTARLHAFRHLRRQFRARLARYGRGCLSQLSYVRGVLRGPARVGREVRH